MIKYGNDKKKRLQVVQSETHAKSGSKTGTHTLFNAKAIYWSDQERDRLDQSQCFDVQMTGRPTLHFI